MRTIRTSGLLLLALLVLDRSAAADSAAERAVEEARKYAGSEITILWEAGLQALDPLHFSGPRWTALTGIEVTVVEVPIDRMFTAILREHDAGSGAYDALNVVPSWLPDLARAGALEPLDAYVDRHGYLDEIEDIAPVYRDNQMRFAGRIYALPDDGDVFLLYYRKDVFTANGLEPPATWAEFAEVGQRLTTRYAPELYGAGLALQAPYAMFMFQERFRVAGGRFFDPETMRATVNGAIGIEVLSEMRDQAGFMPPGVEDWGFVENLAAFLAGDTAMTISWPPYGRWAAGYGAGEDALSWLPRSAISGKVGYALPPGGHPELAAGFGLAVSAASRNKEAAYLFIQWMNSSEVSLQRVQLPYALRDPFRESHFESAEYKALWPDAAEYLAILRRAADSGLVDLSILETDQYEDALRDGIDWLWDGGDPRVILDDVATRWNAVTARVGIDKQREAYLEWAAKPNAYPVASQR